MSASTRKDIRQFDRRLAIFCLLVLGLTVLYPTLRMTVAAITAWRFDAVYSGAGFDAVRNTIVLCLASVGAAGACGTALAFLFSRVAFPGRRIAAGLAFLPFALPPLVGVFSFYFLIGGDGLLPRILGRMLGLEHIALPGFLAILLVHIHSFYVFFYAMVSAALDTMDYSQTEAARTLGASRWHVFSRVTLPSLAPALLGAALLAFMSSAASFSAPFFLGRDLPVLSVEVYYRRVAGDEPGALSLTLCLAAVSLLGVLLFRRSRRTVTGASKGVPRPLRSRSGKTLVTLAAWAIVFALLLPHLTLIWLSFVDYPAWGTELLPVKLTFANYARVFQDPDGFAPIRNSLWMSGLGTAAAVLVGLPAAYLIARKRRLATAVNFLAMIPWALPGTVIAINLIVAFNDPWLPLANTIWILPVAYYVRNVPLYTRMAAAAIEPFDASLLEAGQTLGASRAFCFLHIVAPMLAPAFVAASALVFAAGLGEFVTSILLCNASNKPIAVKIGEIMHDSVIVDASAYSVLLMIFVAGAFLLARRFSSRVL